MVTEIVMYCNECNWVHIPAEEVKITINLCNDNKEYYAVCPNCGEKLFNSRSI